MVLVDGAWGVLANIFELGELAQEHLVLVLFLRLRNAEALGGLLVGQGQLAKGCVRLL